jgi:hypothetical protein
MKTENKPLNDTKDESDIGELCDFVEESSKEVRAMSKELQDFNRQFDTKDDWVKYFRKKFFPVRGLESIEELDICYIDIRGNEVIEFRNEIESFIKATTQKEREEIQRETESKIIQYFGENHQMDLSAGRLNKFLKD